MPRYIDAEKLENDGWSASRTYQQDAKTMVYETKKMTDFPTADVVERRVGKWVYEKVNSYASRTYCSECGNSAPFICVSGDYYGRYMHGETNKTNFCPNCGARMKGEDDELSTSH